MSNEQKNSRTVIEDLPATEQELTEKEMEKVQGGVTISPAPPNTASSLTEGGGMTGGVTSQAKDQKTT